jgi:hypothetical protein
MRLMSNGNDAMSVLVTILVLSAIVERDMVASWAVDSSDDNRQMDDDIADEPIQNNVPKPSSSSSAVAG